MLLSPVKVFMTANSHSYLFLSAWFNLQRQLRICDFPFQKFVTVVLRDLGMFLISICSKHSH